MFVQIQKLFKKIPNISKPKEVQKNVKASTNKSQTIKTSASQSVGRDPPTGYIIYITLYTNVLLIILFEKVKINPKMK